jgi:hypothetical protein
VTTSAEESAAERMTLRVPQLVRRARKATRPKKTGMTCDQAAAIVTEGLQQDRIMAKKMTRPICSEADYDAALRDIEPRRADLQRTR